MPTVLHKEVACEEDILRDFMGLSDQTHREIDIGRSGLFILGRAVLSRDATASINSKKLTVQPVLHHEPDRCLSGSHEPDLVTLLGSDVLDELG